jgi:hypothetical protein
MVEYKTLKPIETSGKGQISATVHPNTYSELSIPFEPNQTDINLIVWIYQDNGMIFETLEAHNLNDTTRTVKYEVRSGNHLLKKYRNK